MSDPNLSMQRQIQALEEAQERLRKSDVAAIYLPWTQRILNPLPLASSGATWGDLGQPWEVYALAYTVTVFVVTTNSATQFWTIALKDSAGTTLASVNTSAIAANTGARLSTTTITQPGSSNTFLSIIPTATLSPGAIYIFPALSLLRVGN